MEYLAVFTSALIAATLLPMYSEAVLGGLIIKGYSPALLWFFATLGNTLGSVINWLLGKYLIHFQQKRWFPFSEKQIKTSSDYFNKYGTWSLLFAWLPIIGDPLTLIAGMTRVKLPLFITLVALGKGLRYAIVVYAAVQAQ